MRTTTEHYTGVFVGGIFTAALVAHNEPHDVDLAGLLFHDPAPADEFMPTLDERTVALAAAQG